VTFSAESTSNPRDCFSWRDLWHGDDAVPFVFGVVDVELFGAERAKAESKPAPSES
jgi:hypothetical protein